MEKETKTLVKNLNKIALKYDAQKLFGTALDFRYKAVMLTLLDSISTVVVKKKNKQKGNRKPSAYSLFLKKEMGKGLSMKEASQKWSAAKK